MAEEHHFRARTDEPRRIIQDGETDLANWQSMVEQVASMVRPDDQDRKPVSEHSMGSRRFIGLEAVSNDYSAPPPGWRLIRAGWLHYITPYRGKPKTGSTRPDTREQGKAIDKVGRYSDARFDLPDIDNLAVQLPAVSLLADGTVLLQTKSGGFGPCYPKEPTWEPLKASEYHALIEADEAAKVEA